MSTATELKIWVHKEITLLNIKPECKIIKLLNQFLIKISQSGNKNKDYSHSLPVIKLDQQITVQSMFNHIKCQSKI